MSGPYATTVRNSNADIEIGRRLAATASGPRRETAPVLEKGPAKRLAVT